MSIHGAGSETRARRGTGARNPGPEDGCPDDEGATDTQARNNSVGKTR